MIFGTIGLELRDIDGSNLFKLILNYYTNESATSAKVVQYASQKS